MATTLQNGFSKQSSPKYACDSSTRGAKINISNYGVDNYGLVIAKGGDEDIVLTNVFHTGKLGTRRSKPGCFFAMVWAPSGKSARSFVWDNSGLAALLVKLKLSSKFVWIRQNLAEAAFRIKSRNILIRGVKFLGILDPQTNRPFKQPAQFRDSDIIITVEDCEFKDGYPDVGPQEIAGKGFDPTQQVKKIIFRRCKFWERLPAIQNGHKGVVSMTFEDCELRGKPLPDQTWE